MVVQADARERAAATSAALQRDLVVLRHIRSRRNELLAFVTACEAKFGLSSSEIHAALDDGRLVETDEVCDWIMAHEVLQQPAW